MDLFIRQLWANRRNTRGSLQSLPTALLAILIVAAFTIAGGFSAQISSSVGAEALLKGKNCGTLYPNFSNPDSYYASLPYVAEVFSNAANYVQQCYLGESNAVGCNRFIKQRLSGNVDFAAACPFSDTICRSKSGNTLLDTGYVDSHEAFGLNAPRDRRVLWRNVLHCAPLATAGFTKTNSSDNATEYYYGNHDPIPYIYKADSVASQYERVLVDLSYPETHAELNLEAFRAAVDKRTFDPLSSSFEPIDLLLRTDADVHVILLSGNGVLFLEPTSDEWYRVSSTPSNIGEVLGDDARTYQRYLPTEPASALGCTDQYQFCNSALKGTTGCGPLASLRDALRGAVPFFNASYDELITGIKSGVEESSDLARLIYMSSRIFGIDKTITGIVAHLGSSALLSQRTLSQGDQGPIPSNQWQLDVSYLWNITLAVMQASFVDTAYGPTDSDILQSWVNFTSPALTDLCSSQIIQSTAYGSFSMFGLLFTFIVGVLVVLVSYLLEPISTYLFKRGYSQYAHLEWVANGTLQLQRLAYEEQGTGAWSKCIDNIPTHDKLLRPLDITDLEHPVLRLPHKEYAKPPPDDTSRVLPYGNAPERQDSEGENRGSRDSGDSDTISTARGTIEAVDTCATKDTTHAENIEDRQAGNVRSDAYAPNLEHSHDDDVMQGHKVSLQ
ncbi:hypothetical protein F4808DRAFT_466756 [Astrocystis sublimbata]|nr:hypothetical protein F4808DRAFT_466756 [Astrocystis sublimbata]